MPVLLKKVISFAGVLWATAVPTEAKAVAIAKAAP
jgi:hypothetical protein